MLDMVAAVGLLPFSIIGSGPLMSLVSCLCKSDTAVIERLASTCSLANYFNNNTAFSFSSAEYKGVLDRESIWYSVLKQYGN